MKTIYLEKQKLKTVVSKNLHILKRIIKDYLWYFRAFNTMLEKYCDQITPFHF